MGVPMPVERRDPQDLRVLEVEHALVLVLLQERVEHGPGLLAVLREHVALAHVLGALAAGERRLVEGDVADQVEGVEVLADLLGQRVEDQALVLELVDDRLLALGAPSSASGSRRGWRTASSAPSGEVAQALGDELAVLVEVLDPLGDDRGADAVDVDLAPPLAAGRDGDVRRLAVDDRLVLRRLRRDRLLIVLGRRGVVRRRDRVVLARLVDLRPARRRSRDRRSGWWRRGSRSG